MIGARTTRALLVGEGFREEVRQVIDLGERRDRWVSGEPRTSRAGRKRVSYEDALVLVVGETKPRWIALARLEPAAGTRAHDRWLDEVHMVRPLVERAVPNVDDDRRASRRRYEARLRARRSEERSDPASVRPPTAGRDRRAPRGAEAGAS